MQKQKARPLATPLSTAFYFYLTINLSAMADFKHHNPDHGIFYPRDDSVVAYAILPELT